MKPIGQMNLAECISVVRQLTPDELELDFQWRVGARIEKLTQWIPVEEQLPTEEDGDGNGYVEFWNTRFKMSRYYKYDFLPERYGLGIIGITHWKRITPPEGV
jgi:hypothetical protein